MVYKNMEIDNLLKPQQQEVSKGSYAIFGHNSLIINMLPPPPPPKKFIKNIKRYFKKKKK